MPSDWIDATQCVGDVNKGHEFCLGSQKPLELLHVQLSLHLNLEVKVPKCRYIFVHVTYTDILSDILNGYSHGVSFRSNPLTSSVMPAHFSFAPVLCVASL